MLQTKLVCELINGYSAIVAYSENTCPISSEELIEEIKEKIFENEAHEDVQTLIDSNSEKIDGVKTLVEGLYPLVHSCPSGWSRFQFNCYKFWPEQKVWSEARDECLSHEVKILMNID